jgi:hypothetical protein
MARISVHWFSRSERKPLRGWWQRRFLVEYALVALLATFTGLHFLFVFINS